MLELEEVIRKIQDHATGIEPNGHQSFPESGNTSNVLFVPIGAGELDPATLPLSVRAENALKKLGVKRMGDLDGMEISRLLRIEKCGKKTVREIKDILRRAGAGEFRIVHEELRPIDLLFQIDELLSRLPSNKLEMVELRLGGKSGPPATLVAIGEQFKISRERVRQIVSTVMKQLPRKGGPKTKALLDRMASTCLKDVHPVTSALLLKWAATAWPMRYSPEFYVRAIGEMCPKIPTWTDTRNYAARTNARSRAIADAIESFLQAKPRPLSLAEALQIVRQAPKLKATRTDEFLNALRQTKCLKVEFPAPDKPEVSLRSLRLRDVAKAILEESPVPLVPEAILATAKARFGPALVPWTPSSLVYCLTSDTEFYLLGPRSYGMCHHFSLPQCQWHIVREDCFRFLQKENRPVSTIEIVNSRVFSWTRELNSYELAQVVRGDDRFIDLGKFLFALADWGIEERALLKDLIPKVLDELNRPAAVREIYEKLKQLRSVSASSMPPLLRGTPGIQDYGFGHFGLKAWGERAKTQLASNTAFIEQVVRRADPPLRFARLLEILGFPPEGKPARLLWPSITKSPKILREPDTESPQTVLVYKGCSLEKALVGIATELDSPVPDYEFQWHLNDCFGPIFERCQLADISQCLKQSPLFVRTIDGKFILDTHLERLGLEEDAIRTACHKILVESHELVACEDLIDRLQADGRVWEDLSPAILAALLRVDERFEEIGHKRFRIRPCKR